MVLMGRTIPAFCGMFWAGRLCFFFSTPSVFLLLIVPVLAGLILFVWKKQKTFELFEPLVFSFLMALAATALSASAYRFLFDSLFRPLVLAAPLFVLVPLAALLTLFLALYAYWSLSQPLPNGSPARISVSAFFISQLVALGLIYALSWAILSGGLNPA